MGVAATGAKPVARTFIGGAAWRSSRRLLKGAVLGVPRLNDVEDQDEAIETAGR